MSAQPAKTAAVQTGIFHHSARLTFVLLSLGSVAAGVRGAVTGNWMFPFGIVLCATFVLAALAFRFALDPANIHVVESPKH